MFKKSQKIDGSIDNKRKRRRRERTRSRLGHSKYNQLTTSIGYFTTEINSFYYFVKKKVKKIMFKKSQKFTYNNDLSFDLIGAITTSGI